MALFDDSAEARTELPTERRRRQAREHGLVARSVELLFAARLLAIWGVFAWWFVSFATAAGSWLRLTFEHAGQISAPASGLVQLKEQTWRFAMTATWPLLIVTAVLLLVHFLQVGWLWRWESAAPQVSRLSPMTGLQRLLSAATLARGLSMTLKLIFVSGASFAIVSPLFPIVPSNATVGFSGQLAAFGSSTLQLVSYVALAMLAFGALDYGWQRWRFERSLQMTREELREELKELEGDPRVKHQRRDLARPRRAASFASSATESDRIRAA